LGRVKRHASPLWTLQRLCFEPDVAADPSDRGENRDPGTATEAFKIQLTEETRLENGPFGAREKSAMPLRGRVQPCVRPINAALMAAGPDEVRGSDPKSLERARSAWTRRVCSIPGSTGLSSHLTTLALADRTNVPVRAGTSATWPEPRRIDCGRALPRRSARSCWQARPTPAWPTYARAAWQPRSCWHYLGVQTG